MSSVKHSGWTAPPFEGVSIILLVTGGASILWDPELSARLAALEEQLDGAHVTAAAWSGGGPSLRHALDAAGFVGSRRIFVVVPPEADAPSVASRMPVETLAPRSDDELRWMVQTLLGARAA